MVVVFCVYGFADIAKETKYETVTKMDYYKIGRFIRGEWPKPLPEMILWRNGGDQLDHRVDG